MASIESRTVAKAMGSITDGIHYRTRLSPNQEFVDHITRREFFSAAHTDFILREWNNTAHRDVSTGDLCHSCLFPLSFRKKVGSGLMSKVSVDRIDNSDTYRSTNVTSVCLMCQRGRNTSSSADFEVFIKQTLWGDTAIESLYECSSRLTHAHHARVFAMRALLASFYGSRAVFDAWYAKQIQDPTCFTCGLVTHACMRDLGDRTMICPRRMSGDRVYDEIKEHTDVQMNIVCSTCNYAKTCVNSAIRIRPRRLRDCYIARIEHALSMVRGESPHAAIVPASTMAYLKEHEQSMRDRIIALRTLNREDPYPDEPTDAVKRRAAEVQPGITVGKLRTLDSRANIKKFKSVVRTRSPYEANVTRSAKRVVEFTPCRRNP